jgi:hypothetical protein
MAEVNRASKAGFQTILSGDGSRWDFEAALTRATVGQR